MPNIQIRTELKKLFVASLREIFAADDLFPYNDNDTLTSILITTKMPLNTAQNQLPHIVWNGASYSASIETLTNNLASEAFDTTTKLSSRKYSAAVFFSCTLSAVSTVFDEANVIGDKIFNYLFVDFPDEFQDLGLFVDSVNVGEATLKESSPQTQYVCPITVQGHVRLTWSVTPTGQTLANKVRLTVTQIQL